MRYAIPQEKNVQTQEKINILRAAGDEWSSISQALQFITERAGDNYVSKPGDYSKLFKIYMKLGLSGRKTEEMLFPSNERSNEQFQEELEKLWRVLELHTLEKNDSVLTTYQQYQEDPKACDSKLREAEQKEAEKEKEEPLMVVDQDSPYYHFVAGTAYEKLLNGWKELKDQLSPDQITTRMLGEDMEKLLSRMQLQYLRRNEMGSMLPMTKQDHTEICELYRNCVNDLKHCSDEEQNLEGYKKLRSLMRQNERILRNLSEDDLPVFANVIRGTELPVIELRNTKNETVGDAMSKRETVEYVDENGQLRRGFFTAVSTENDRMDDVKAILDQAIKQYPQYKDFFQTLRKSSGNYRAYTELEQAMAADWIDPNANAVDAYRRTSRNVPKKFRQDEGFKRAFEEVVQKLDDKRCIHSVLELSGIIPGDELVKRSSAMSDVASFLGFPDLLAKSQQVTVKRGDKEVKGVMMEAADLDTVDPSTLERANFLTNHPFYNTNQREFDSQPFLSSLADLQILDFLCGNTDRHDRNFFLRQDFSDPKHPKLVGVQGIDNDNSFGNIDDGGMLRLASSENLKIITPKMAEAITNMKREDLERILEPYQFSRPQLIAAENRLDKLKDMITKGKQHDKLTIKNDKLVNTEGSIHIVKDQEWASLTQSALIPEKVRCEGYDEYGSPNMMQPQNIFVNAYECRRKLKEKQSSKFGNKRYDAKQTIAYNKHDMETIAYDQIFPLMETEYEKLQRFKQRFHNEHGDRDTRSQEFKDMRSAMERYMEAYRQMQTASAKQDPDAIGMAGDKPKSRDERIRDAFRSLDEARKALDGQIDRYLNKTHRWLKSDRNKNRIAIAKELKNEIKQPESLNYYQSTLKLQKHFKDTMAQKDDFQLASYATEQIYGKMKLTLSGNLSKFYEDNPIRVKGIKAFNAQNRLWKYGQSEVNKDTISVKKQAGEVNEKKRVSLEKLQAELKKAPTVTADMEKIRADLKAIREYADTLEQRYSQEMETYRELKSDQTNPAGYKHLGEIRDHSAGLKKQIDQLLEKEDGEAVITPANVRGVIGALFAGENKIAKGYTPEKSNTNAMNRAKK